MPGPQLQLKLQLLSWLHPGLAPKLVGEILLTSNVLFIGPWEVPRYGVDERAGIWVGMVVSDSGEMPAAQQHLTPDQAD